MCLIHKNWQGKKLASLVTHRRYNIDFEISIVDQIEISNVYRREHYCMSGT